MKRDDFKRFGVCPRQHSAFCDGEFGRRDFLKSVIAALVAVAAAVGAVGQVVAADKPTAKVIPAEPLYHERCGRNFISRPAIGTITTSIPGTTAAKAGSTT